MSVMIVAGEPSSDIHAASFVSGLQTLEPDVRVFGMGGSHLRAGGVETVVDSEKSASIMGITEIVGSLGIIIKAYRKLLRTARERKPDLVVLVDYPDFNLRLARDIHKLGIPVFYFISPQIWAWRQGRVHTIRKYVAKVATIFPFEVDFYLQHGVDAHFVGHPFLDRSNNQCDRETFLELRGLDPSRPVVALLPGSRKSEIERLLEPMLDGFGLLENRIPGVQGLLPVAPGLDTSWLEQQSSRFKALRVINGNADAALRVANAAVVASGTATIEAALAKVPFLVVYKLSPVTYRIGKFLVKGVKHFSMSNLVAERKVVEELLQDEVTPESIANELERILTDVVYAEQIRSGLSVVRKGLCASSAVGATAGERAARLALSILSKPDENGVVTNE